MHFTLEVRIVIIEHMRKVPKHKFVFALGILFFIASPFLFYFAPQWLMPILCTPSPRSYLPCSNEFLIIGVVAMIISLAIGVSLILWALYKKR